ncbi:MAG: hypothetical protein ACXU82_15380 [Caulobacteraceae bacterium]
MSLPSQVGPALAFITLARPFGAFSPEALTLACPFTIVRTPLAPTRRRKA